MMIFSSLTQARREGFSWVEYRPDLELHLVRKDFRRADGLKQVGLALARPNEAAEGGRSALYPLV